MRPESGLERYHMNRIIQLTCLFSSLFFSVGALAAGHQLYQKVAVGQLGQLELGGQASADTTTGADATASGDMDAGQSAEMDADGDMAAPESEATPAEPAAPVVVPDVVEPDSNADMEVNAEEEEAEAEEPSGWEMDFHGYFRAPLAVSINSRPDPDNTDGDESVQGTFGSNHLVDGNLQGYYSFGFTRLQEGDWAEVLITAKRKHVAATVGMMGWWYQFVGKGNTDAILWPGLGYVTLDTDFNLGSIRPNIELKTGAFLSVYGANGIYDTYIFGRTHLIGESLKLTLPINDNFQLAITHGFGGNKNGVVADSDATAVTLAHYLTIAMNIVQKVDVGVYYNSSWSHDPSHYEAGGTELNNGAPLPEYEEWRKARMRTIGADVHLRLPRFGHLWAAYSHIALKNGWALSETVEIMHSAGGNGLASNYMGASGSGSMNNLTWQYENSVQNIRGAGTGKDFPDLTLTVFGMMAATTRDLEDGETIDEQLNQVKGGADLTFWPQKWVGIMFRYDGVNVNLDANGDGNKEYTYHVFTPRVVFKSNFLSNESIWFQLSKYSYGKDAVDHFAAANGTYDSPDELVFKMQANMSW